MLELKTVFAWLSQNFVLFFLELLLSVLLFKILSFWTSINHKIKTDLLTFLSEIFLFHLPFQEPGYKEPGPLFVLPLKLFYKKLRIFLTKL